MPQLITSAQPSEMPPQFLPSAEQVVGVQVEPAPQTLATPPPPQVSVPEQLPQVIWPPQPSGIVPQSLPWAEQVVGTQGAASCLGVPPLSSLQPIISSAAAANARVEGYELIRRIDSSSLVWET